MAEINDIIRALQIAVKEASTDQDVSRSMLIRAAKMIEESEIKADEKKKLIPELNSLVALSFDSTNFTVNSHGRFQQAIDNLIDKLSGS